MPLPLTPLIGRDAECAAIYALLADQGARLLTVTGPPGVGKTRVAVEVAARLSRAAPGEVFFIQLDDIEAGGDVLMAVADALDLAVGRPDLVRERLREALWDRRVLLVLDTAEHVRGAAPDLVSLLEHISGLTLLLTSRSSLHVGGERCYGLSPLALPPAEQPASLATLEAYAATRYFLYQLRATGVPLPVTAEHVGAIAAICDRLDGLPLAIELAAARCAVLTPLELLRQLDRWPHLLTNGRADAIPRHRTLRSAIGWSYDLLAPPTQALFRALGTLGDTWPLAAVRAITAGQMGDEATLDHLATLVSSSLVRRVESASGELRFQLLRTIRSYALERLIHHGEYQIVQERPMECTPAAAEAPALQQRSVGEAPRPGLLVDTPVRRTGGRGLVRPPRLIAERIPEGESTHMPTPTMHMPTPTIARLTSREHEVLRLVAQGWTNAEVASRLSITARTVNAHLTSVYAKLGVCSWSAATRVAVEHGLA